MANRQQRVLLNGRISKWTNILAGVPHDSGLAPLLFLIYVNDLPNGWKSLCKIFTDGTSLFSKIEDIDTSNIDIGNDLVKMIRCAYQWKMSFKPDINKQATEVCFSQRREKYLYHLIIFNNNNLLTSPCRKHADLIVNSELSFNKHITQKISKCNNMIGLMKWLSSILSRKHLKKLNTLQHFGAIKGIKTRSDRRW